LTIGSLGRVYWAFAGNAYARLIFALPLWNPKWV
jgi:Ni,Fe-hydrogenase I cytochrome b subunit